MLFRSLSNKIIIIIYKLNKKYKESRNRSQTLKHNREALKNYKFRG